MTAPREVAEPWRSMIPDPHPAANCGPLSGLVVAPGRECLTCGTVPTPISSQAAGRIDRAYAAFGDRADSGGPGTAAGLVEAVEVARTVELTPAVERALFAALAAAEPGRQHAAVRVGLLDVFDALGLRVVEP